ncbi:hypothetical protein PybrP1_009184 [[Pythium] brassicae (nom. inval.)]|nr:hypothetical protein PybrP1_009184 [[Pythium] brassicae (nom. inval.)]
MQQHDDEEDAGRCLLCDQRLPRVASARCLTDCAHEFCLACVCRELSERKNRCPACHAHVKKVHQLNNSADAGGSGAPPVAPASVKFCNATYVLNVSIWSVDDPARELASLFRLEHARLIHQGKLIKKGDVWPGTIVQLFGTRKSSGEQQQQQP